jgi:hypothetical protein
LVEAIFHGLELGLELLVLHGQSAISILQQGFEILYPLVSRKKLPLGNPGFLLKRRVLIDKLRVLNSEFCLNPCLASRLPVSAQALIAPGSVQGTPSSFVEPSNCCFE